MVTIIVNDDYISLVVNSTLSGVFSALSRATEKNSSGNSVSVSSEMLIVIHCLVTVEENLK